MAQMITTKYGVYMPKVEAWIIDKIDREERQKKKAQEEKKKRGRCGDM